MITKGTYLRNLHVKQRDRGVEEAELFSFNSGINSGILGPRFCIGNGENSETSNHMLSATEHSEIECLTKFLNMSKLQNRCTRGSRYRVSTERKIFRSSNKKSLKTFFHVRGSLSTPEGNTH